MWRLIFVYMRQTWRPPQLTLTKLYFLLGAFSLQVSGCLDLFKIFSMLYLIISTYRYYHVIPESCILYKLSIFIMSADPTLGCKHKLANHHACVVDQLLREQLCISSWENSYFPLARVARQCVAGHRKSMLLFPRSCPQRWLDATIVSPTYPNYHIYIGTQLI